jgi:hypothetical protein
MAADWPGLRVVRAMGSLGTTSFSRRGAVRAGWKGRISLVASFVLRSIVRNLFLHCAQCVKAGGWSYPRATGIPWARLKLAGVPEPSFLGKVRVLILFLAQPQSFNIHATPYCPTITIH